MRRVKINVFDNNYVIKTDAEEEYVREIALYLEEKVNEVDKHAAPMTIPRPLLLASLKIADDYFRLKREFEEYKSGTEEKSRKLVEILDSSLKQEEFPEFQSETGGEK